MWSRVTRMYRLPSCQFSASVFDLGSGTGRKDGQTDDGHQCLMPPPYWGGVKIICNIVWFLCSCWNFVVSDTRLVLSSKKLLWIHSIAVGLPSCLHRFVMSLETLASFLGHALSLILRLAFIFRPQHTKQQDAVLNKFTTKAYSI